ncbi:MAG TPA: EsaB/YukD family protein [Candidatus Dormibacteraeota bacterium]|nr:EsaB/YukD family protein [Candidatus Dormibacteraeota bacterium]
MRDAILVTVEHERGRTTLSVPDDVAVELLLPQIVDACHADGTATWALSPRGGRPVAGDRTLREAGVWQGAVLALRQVEPGEPQPDPPAAGGRAKLRLFSKWGARERLAHLERAVTDAPRRRGVVIAVASLERGCGKTTVAALLAALLAKARSQPPLAIDGDLGTRALSRMLAPAFRMTSSTYLDLVERRLRLADLRPGAIGPACVRLLPAPDRPQLPPDAAGCRALLAELRSTWGVTVLDCAAGFGTPWAQAAWAAADQFVLVTGGQPRERAALEPVTASLAEAGAAVAVVTLSDDPMAATLLRAGELPWEAAPAAWRTTVAGAAASLVARW